MKETNPVKIIIGVDTHKDVHAAVAIDGIGARLGTLAIPVSPKGYKDLETWARAFGAIHATCGPSSSFRAALDASALPVPNRGRPEYRPSPSRSSMHRAGVAP